MSISFHCNGLIDQRFCHKHIETSGTLECRAHCSYSTIAIWMDDVLQVPVSRGYLAKLCNGIISASLAAMHEQLKQAIPRQSRLGSDESISASLSGGQSHRLLPE